MVKNLNRIVERGAWIVLLLSVVIVYGRLLTAGFLDWDDAALVTHNWLVHEISLRSLRAAFTTFDPELYVPITFLSYQVDWLVSNGQAWMFHLTNVGLFAGIVCLGFAILQRFMRRTTALLLALLFAVHPLNVESVAWIAARKDLLSTIFLLGSLLLFLRYGESARRNLLYWSMALFVCAVLSKVTAVMLVPLLFLLPKKRGRTEWMPFVLVGTAMLIVGFVAKHASFDELMWSERVVLWLKGNVLLFWHMIAPIGLSPRYPYGGPTSFLQLDVVAAFTVMIVFAMTMWRSKKSAIRFGMGWFLLFLLPTLLTVAGTPQWNLTADRYAMLPLVGLLIAVGAQSEQWSARARKVGSCAVCVLAVTFACMNMRMAGIWHDTRSLFVFGLSRYPGSYTMLNGLARNEQKMHNDDAAKQLYLKAASTSPRLADAWIGLGVLAETDGRMDEATDLYKHAWDVRPRNPLSAFALGKLFLRAGKKDDAVLWYERALHASDPFLDRDNILIARNNLATLYGGQGRLEEEQRQYRMVIEMDPSFMEAYMNLAVSLRESGKNAEAVGVEHEMQKWRK